MLSYATEGYRAQNARWPQSGRHIMAHYDDERVVVYQAYRPEIGRFAIEHQRFGGAFKMDRMTWIKPNFLWMMYRCDWARSEGQEVVLAIHLKRAGFDSYLRDAVYSSFVADIYGTKENWSRAVKTSSVRLQWDPDHSPSGGKLERRAIQLGLRGDAVYRYVNEHIVKIEDATPFVTAQREFVGALEQLVLPKEDVYPVRDADVAARLGLAASA